MIKLTRNPQFHRKVFAFFKFCFDHWVADKTEWEFFDERTQFDKFRKDLTIMAGFCHKIYNIKGDLRLEAQSLSYGNMDQDEFERCNNALINAAMRTVFKRAVTIRTLSTACMRFLDDSILSRLNSNGF